MKYMPSSRLLSFAVLFFMLAPVMQGQDTINCYKANIVADKVWAIVENNTVNIYLVEGKDSVRVKFQALPDNTAGAVYYIRLLRQ